MTAGFNLRCAPPYLDAYWDSYDSEYESVEEAKEALFEHMENVALQWSSESVGEQFLNFGGVDTYQGDPVVVWGKLSYDDGTDYYLGVIPTQGKNRYEGCYLDIRDKLEFVEVHSSDYKREWNVT